MCSKVSPSVAENWKLMAAIFLVKKLVKLLAVREEGGAGGWRRALKRNINMT